MQGLDYYLQPINKHQLTLKPLQRIKNSYFFGMKSIENIDKVVRGVLKINYQGEERLVLVKYDNPPGWLDGNVYLFK